MSDIKHYLSLVKFSHTIFALPFACIGFTLALREGYSFSLQQLLLVILCMVTARNAAMAFNRYIDRHFDLLNPRTAVREIPAGIIKSKNAVFFILVNCALFILSTYFINPICFYLSPVALFVVLFYSYTKRFTPLCHLVLGCGLALAPIGAYLAVTGHFSWLPLLFSFTVFCWVSGFDIIYALQDETFDRDHQLNSIPVLLGTKGALHFSEILHVFAIAFVIAAGFVGHFNFLYWIGTMVFTGLIVYQHTIVKPHDLSRVNLAFGTTNGIASVVFATFTIVSFYL
ncbi:MAG: putative 4-hydroxybenzoate polyprenyltransferase [Bacteroidetes bacterium]|jgi:4-hydroxybenzoate polyprenyltransferase|nr:putative 4-hydroxybenzoate polyprenyltransferase [Bacteroidota bacterium]MDF2451523.1 putative 4-hydroxybenzoate polyprenyltransferase [Bacteroidota bacterium]